MVSSGVVDDIRAESGNIRYEYFYPMDDAETVLLIDSWKNQQSIDIHHESPMMEQIIRLRDKYGLTMKVERYISDEMGIPASDNKYIRN
jgi:quinol monooxygenase YgiN